MSDSVLKNGHWVFEDFKQRMKTKEWRQILLDENDRIFFHGISRQLQGQNMGAGVVEVFKTPEEQP